MTLTIPTGSPVPALGHCPPWHRGPCLGLGPSWVHPGLGAVAAGTARGWGFVWGMAGEQQLGQPQRGGTGACEHRREDFI